MDISYYEDFDSYVAGHNDMCRQVIEFFETLYPNDLKISKSVLMTYLNGCIVKGDDEQ